MKVLGWIAGILLLIGLLGVGAVFVLDAQIRERVEAEALTRVTATVPLTGADIAVEGFPVAWHALRLQFPAVDLTAETAPVTLAAGEVTARDLDARLVDVSVADDAVRAAGLQGSARLDYADVSRLAGTPIAYGQGDRIRAEGSLEVLGQTVTGTITAVPVVDAATQAITLESPQVDVAGVRLPDQVISALVDTVWQPVPLALPYGLSLASVTATPDGLQLAVTGTDVELQRG
ncbi:MAG: DUF2993 domain-containing protein [Propionibacteriaceae bacterium]|nr:DUF2993 domain-containing protein [Propionibacteriaceae bacterium]